MGKRIGIGVGGTNVKIALVDEKGKIIYSNSVPTYAKMGYEYTVNNIKQSIRDLMKETRTDEKTIEGIGFAIPMDDVTGMIEDLQQYGYVTGAYLGVMVLDVDSNAQFYGLPAGAYVESTSAGGAAEKGGILAGDIITEVGGFKVTSVSDLTRVLRKFEAGQTVSVEVYRTGNYKTLSIVLDEKPREETEPQRETPGQNGQFSTMPEGGDFGDIYEYFRKYFG